MIRLRKRITSDRIIDQISQAGIGNTRWITVCNVAQDALRLCTDSLGDERSGDIVTAVNASASGATRRVDLLSEEHIVGQLNGIGFRTLSEERGISGPDDAAYFAIIDPLDGSSVAVRGMDTYAVAIACGPIVDGDILFSNIEFGVVASHYGLFYAQRGLGAYLNEDALSVSSVTSIGDAVLRQSRYSFLLLESSGSLLLGSTALEISLIAAGVMDAYVEPKKRKVFDYAAASLILREAGGYLTTMEGGALHRGPLDVLSTSDLLATCTESLALEINHALARRT